MEDIVTMFLASVLGGLITVGAWDIIEIWYLSWKVPEKSVDRLEAYLLSEKAEPFFEHIAQKASSMAVEKIHVYLESEDATAAIERISTAAADRAKTEIQGYLEGPEFIVAVDSLAERIVESEKMQALASSFGDMIAKGAAQSAAHVIDGAIGGSVSGIVREAKGAFLEQNPMAGAVESLAEGLERGRTGQKFPGIGKVVKGLAARFGTGKGSTQTLLSETSGGTSVWG